MLLKDVKKVRRDGTYLYREVGMKVELLRDEARDISSHQAMLRVLDFTLGL